MTSPINAAYFTAITAQVNAAGSCAELQAATNLVVNSVNASLASATAQLALITPMIALLSAPSANVTAVVTWITSFITDYLTPELVPYTTLATQITDMTAAIATLTTAINTKAAQFTGCTIIIP